MYKKSVRDHIVRPYCDKYMKYYQLSHFKCLLCGNNHIVFSFVPEYTNLCVTFGKTIRRDLILRRYSQSRIPFRGIYHPGEILP